MTRTVSDVGKMVRDKHPGLYDDMDDAELGQSIVSHNPGQYKDVVDTESGNSQVSTDAGPGYKVASIGAPTAPKESTGFISGLMDLIGGNNERTETPAKVSPATRIKAMLEGLGGTGPAMAPIAANASAQNPRLAASALAESVPYAVAPEGNLLKQILSNFAISGGSATAKGLINGQPLGQAVGEGTKEGLIAGTTAGGIGLAGKLASFIPGLLRDTAAVGSGVGIPKMKTAVEREFAGKSVFPPGWEHPTQIYDEAASTAQNIYNAEKSKLDTKLSDYSRSVSETKAGNKNSISAANAANRQAIIDTQGLTKKEAERVAAENRSIFNNAGAMALSSFKKLQSDAGANVGAAEQGLIKSAKNNLVSPETSKSAADFVKNKINDVTIVDPSGKASHLSNKELNFLDNLHSELSGKKAFVDSTGKVISQGEVDKLLGFGPNGVNLDSAGIKEVNLPISVARMDSLISKIDDFVQYGPKHQINDITGRGEFHLKDVRNFLNEKVREISPELAQANDSMSVVKDLQTAIGGNVSDKSMASIISKYHAGKLNPREVAALEQFDDLSGMRILENSKPKMPNEFLPQKHLPTETDIPQLHQSVIDEKNFIDKLSGLANQKGGRSILSRYESQTPEVLGNLDELQARAPDQKFIDPVMDQNIAEAFQKKLPGKGGGSGSGEGFGNLARVAILSKTGGAVAPIMSPRLMAAGIQRLPAISSGLNKVGQPVGELIKRLAPPLATRTQSAELIPNPYDAFMSRRKK